MPLEIALGNGTLVSQESAATAVDPQSAVAAAVLSAEKRQNLVGQGDHGDGDGAQYMYYTKPEGSDEEGWVTIGQAHPVYVAQFMRKGMVPLYKFGTFSDYDQQSRWNMNREPYRRILERGGASVFPKEQVLAYGWHRRAPYGLKVEFPQLAGVEIEEHKCSYCPRVFLTRANLEAHESIRHSTVSQQSSLARQLASATTGQLAGPLADLIGGMQKQIEVLTKLVAERDAAPPAAQASAPSGRK